MIKSSILVPPVMGVRSIIEHGARDFVHILDEMIYYGTVHVISYPYRFKILEGKLKFS